MAKAMTLPRACDATRFKVALALLLSLAALVMLTGGCNAIPEGKMPLVPDVPTFQRNVLQAKGPVLVDFYKDDCPTCVVQEAVLEDLSDQYAGQVQFVRFRIREVTMKSTCPEFMKQQNLFWVPTTILYVNGQERKRWVFNHTAGEFRPALDEAIGRLPPGTALERPGTKTVPTLNLTGSKTCTGEGCPIEQ